METLCEGQQLTFTSPTDPNMAAAKVNNSSEPRHILEKVHFCCIWGERAHSLCKFNTLQTPGGIKTTKKVFSPWLSRLFQVEVMICNKENEDEAAYWVTGFHTCRIILSYCLQIPVIYWSWQPRIKSHSVSFSSIYTSVSHEFLRQTNNGKRSTDSFPTEKNAFQYLWLAFHLICFAYLQSE